MTITTEQERARRAAYRRLIRAARANGGTLGAESVTAAAGLVGAYSTRRRLEVLRAAGHDREAIIVAARGHLPAADYDLIADTSDPYLPTRVADGFAVAWAWLRYGGALDHPDFPHGQLLGYTRGCRWTCCLRADRAHDKARRLDAARGIVRGPQPKVAAHLEWLLAAPEQPPVKEVAAACRVSPYTVTGVIAGGPVEPDTARRILTVSRAQVAARLTPAHQIDVGPSRQAALTMLALGYPVAWQRRRLGFSWQLSWLLAAEQITAAHAAAVAALAAQVGERLAVPDGDLLTPARIRQARAAAAKHGVYPPGCYEDGRLVDGAVRDDDAAGEDVEAEYRARVRVAVWTVDGLPGGDIAERLGLHRRTVARLRADVGLSVDPLTHRLPHDPARDARVRDAWHAVDVEHADPKAVWESLLVRRSRPARPARRAA